MNFVFVTIDTLRADRLGCYGYWRDDISPHIDQIAREGVLFSQHYASGIPTGPGFSCLHSGLTCARHKFYLTPWGGPNIINFDDRITTMGDFFLNAGFRTAAVDNLINFGSHMKQFCRGYNYYMNCTEISLGYHHWVTADQVNDMALPWLRENGKKKDKPFFLWIHYWDPHNPYNHPDSFRNHYHHKKYSTHDLHKVKTNAGYEYVPGWGAAHQIDEGDGYSKRSGDKLNHDFYDEEIRYVDDRLGKVYDLLRELDILDDTCIVITSDHGEELGQHHHYWLHKYLYESTIRVPLMVRYPRQFPQDKVIDGFVQQIDILPTLINLAGIEPRNRTIQEPSDIATFDGQSVLPMIQGETGGRPYAFTEGGANWEYSRSLLLPDGWKIIWQAYKNQSELYNVKDDLAEIIDLGEKEPEKRETLSNKLNEVVADLLNGAFDPIPRAGAEHVWPLQYFMQVVMENHGMRQ